MNGPRLFTVFATMWLVLIAGSTAARAMPTCRELPRTAWVQSPSYDVSLLGLVGASASQIASVKDLYLQAMCGTDPTTVWHLATSGEGRMLRVPTALASALDASTPYFPRVDYLYVRGGGPGREMIVVLMANGYQGHVFDVDTQGVWSTSDVAVVESYWNLLPYEFLRRGTSWLHDVAKYEHCFHSRAPVYLLFGAIQFEIVVGEQCDRGLANPLGSMLMPTSNLQSGPLFWFHELAHYNNYYLSSPLALAYADEFARISRDNQRVLGAPLPLLFVERYPQAKDACSAQPDTCAYEQPFGYVTNYAACGESVVEDLGDTLSVAVGATWGVWTQRTHGASPYLFEYRPGTSSSCEYGRYALDRLFNRTGADVDVFAQKLAWVRDNFGFSVTRGMDADGDGTAWSYGAPRGVGDCSDINPVKGGCAANSCDSAADCSDGSNCTTDTCEENICQHRVVDADADGHGAANCGGDDCNDFNAEIRPGAVEVCGDGIDNDCRDGVDDGGAIDALTYYADADQDGYGTGPPQRACTNPGASWATVDGDCNDARALVHPGAVETCGGVEDLNCDGSTSGVDHDGDGYPSCQDCDDSRADVHPGAVELCDRRDNDCDLVVDDGVAGAGAPCASGLLGACAAGTTQCHDGAMVCSATRLPNQVPESCDHIDNDCDGVVDDGVTNTYYRDGDHDGFGDPNDVVRACTLPAGYVPDHTDCYDRNALAHPGQTQLFASDRGDGLFDFDCDGFQTFESPWLATRSCDFDACRAMLGWEGTIAQCGETKPFMTGCWGAVWVCTQINFDTRTQRCR